MPLGPGAKGDPEEPERTDVEVEEHEPNLQQESEPKKEAKK